MRRRKIRKFAENRQTIKQTKNRQTNSSNTEATLIPCGLSGLAGQYYNNEYIQLGARTLGARSEGSKNVTYIEHRNNYRGPSNRRSNGTQGGAVQYTSVRLCMFQSVISNQ